MAEGKKREYKRETCKKRLSDLVRRVDDINNGNADYKYYNKVKDVILFGSLINTDKDKIHDIDLYVIWDDNRKLSTKFNKENSSIINEKFQDMISQLFGEWYLALRYIKGGCGIFSIHSNVSEPIDSMMKIVESDKHVYLVSDYKINDDAMAMIP